MCCVFGSSSPLSVQQNGIHDRVVGAILSVLIVPTGDVLRFWVFRINMNLVKQKPEKVWKQEIACFDTVV